MFADTMSAAIDAARTLTQLDHLSRDIWKAWGSGQIADEAQLLAMQLEARRKAATRRDQAGGHPTWPALDLPATAAPAGSCAGCGDRPTSAPRGERANAAGAGVEVHRLRARRAPHRRRRGARARVLRPDRGRDRGESGDLPDCGQGCHPHRGHSRAPDGPGAPSAGSEEPCPTSSASSLASGRSGSPEARSPAGRWSRNL